MRTSLSRSPVGCFPLLTEPFGPSFRRPNALHQSREHRTTRLPKNYASLVTRAEAYDLGGRRPGASPSTPGSSGGLINSSSDAPTLRALVTARASKRRAFPYPIREKDGSMVLSRLVNTIGICCFSAT